MVPGRQSNFAGPESLASGSGPVADGPANIHLLAQRKESQGGVSGREGLGALEQEGVSGGGSARNGSPLKPQLSYSASRLIAELTELRYQLQSARDSMTDAFKCIDHRPERAKDALIAGICAIEAVL